MILDEIYLVIAERKKHPSEGSYVSSLIAKGRDGILKKIGEESAEVIIASKDGDREQIIHEMADLWFHCLVLLEEEGLSHADIFRELEKRAEKKRRKE